MNYLKYYSVLVLLIVFSSQVYCENNDSLFFESFEQRYHNPDTGIVLGKMLLEEDSIKAFVALGYNYYFKSDYEKALMYFSKTIKNVSQPNLETCMARTGIGLVDQRLGYYDKSYQNLMIAEHFFNNNSASPQNLRLYYTAKTINLIGLATLEYYYTNSLKKINKTLDRIKLLIEKNDTIINNELKVHLYYLYTENYLSNTNNIGSDSTISGYLTEFIKHSDTLRPYFLGSFFELIGKYNLNKSILPFSSIDTTSSDPKSTSSLLNEIYKDESEVRVKTLKKALSLYSIHGDPYQVATSNLLIAKYYINLISAPNDHNIQVIRSYQDSVEKYLSQAGENYHIKDNDYFSRITKGQNIDEINIEAFINNLISLEWYIEYLKVSNTYYAIGFNDIAILKKYLFNSELIERLEKERNKSINGFILLMESANIKTLEAEAEVKKGKYQVFMISVFIVMIITIVLLAINALYLRKKRGEYRRKFFAQKNDLEKAQGDVVRFMEKQAKLEIKDKLIAWFAHETKTQLEIAVTGLTTNKKLLNRLKENEHIVNNSKEFYRLQRINENINIILDNIIQTNRVTKQLREISLKQIENDLRETNISEFLTNLYDKLKYQRENKNIRLKLEGDVDIKTMTYPIALDQIFFNLIINSIRHGFKDRKNGVITIHVKRRQSHFDIEYSDNGAGIHKDLHGEIFKEFFTSIKGGGGTGLGMSITRTLIERDFKGTIRLKESIPNINTTFTFNLKRFDNDKDE